MEAAVSRLEAGATCFKDITVKFFEVKRLKSGMLVKDIKIRT